MLSPREEIQGISVRMGNYVEREAQLIAITNMVIEAIFYSTYSPINCSHLRDLSKIGQEKVNDPNKQLTHPHASWVISNFHFQLNAKRT